MYVFNKCLLFTQVANVRAWHILVSCPDPTCEVTRHILVSLCKLTEKGRVRYKRKQAVEGMNCVSFTVNLFDGKVVPFLHGACLFPHEGAGM